MIHSFYGKKPFRELAGKGKWPPLFSEGNKYQAEHILAKISRISCLATYRTAQVLLATAASTTSLSLAHTNWMKAAAKLQRSGGAVAGLPPKRNSEKFSMPVYNWPEFERSPTLPLQFWLRIAQQVAILSHNIQDNLPDLCTLSPGFLPMECFVGAGSLALSHCWTIRALAFRWNAPRLMMFLASARVSFCAITHLEADLGPKSLLNFLQQT